MTRSMRWGGRPRPPLRGWPPTRGRPSEVLSAPPCSVPLCLCGLPLFFHPPSLDPRRLGDDDMGGVLTGVSGGTMLSPYRLSFKIRHRERGGDMGLGKPVTTPFPRAPEGMAAGRPAASAAPSEARAPGSLPAPRHPDVVRDPSLRWVLRRLRACTPGLACRTGTERRRRTVAPAAPGASRRSGQTRAVPWPRGGGALFSVRGVAAQPGGRTAEIGQVLPVQPGRRRGPAVLARCSSQRSGPAGASCVRHPRGALHPAPPRPPAAPPSRGVSASGRSRITSACTASRSAVSRPYQRVGEATRR